MHAVRGVAVAFCLIMFCSLFTSRARADEWNKLTKITFREPVEIPNRVLPAGTYTFKLLDSPSDRFIVRIMNADQTKNYAIVMGIPDYRLEPTDKTVVRFEERAAGTLPAIRAWFYPGDLYGTEFVYPKSRAMELASMNKTSVPAMPNEVAKATPEKSLEAMKHAHLTAITPSKKEVEVSKAIETTPPAQEVAENKTLPKTASLTPLVALLGGGALMLACGLWFVERRWVQGRET